MNLPDFLQLDDGDIRLKGHRVSLVHVVKLYNEGHSAEMIAAALPTVSLSLLHRVIAFYLDHQDEIDVVVSRHETEMDRLETEHRSSGGAPTLSELRRRLNSMRTAGQG